MLNVYKYLSTECLLVHVELLSIYKVNYFKNHTLRDGGSVFAVTSFRNL